MKQGLVKNNNQSAGILIEVQLVFPKTESCSSRPNSRQTNSFGTFAIPKRS
jgi:hypothetical protein